MIPTRLNGWNRIWIALSVIWLIVINFYAIYGPASIPPQGSVNRNDEITTTFFVWSILIRPVPSKEQYLEDNNLPEDHELTIMDRLAFLPDKGKWERSLRLAPYLLIVFLPPVILWIFVYSLVSTVRWIIRGFK